jgi:hypothetical protein
VLEALIVSKRERGEICGCGQEKLLTAKFAKKAAKDGKPDFVLVLPRGERAAPGGGNLVFGNEFHFL